MKFVTQSIALNRDSTIRYKVLNNVIISYSNPYVFVIGEICLKYSNKTFWQSQSQILHQGHCMTLHTYTPNLKPITLPQFPRYKPHNILKVKATKARSKVKSRSHHHIAHLDHPTNVPTKYQLPTLYGF